MPTRSSAARLVLAGLLAAGAAGCGGHKAAKDETILGGKSEQVSFGQVQHAVDGLYRSHPAVGKYVVRSVTYSPASRDQVLAVCRRGGASSTRQELESSRVAACAPLIFFYYRYGRASAVPDSVDVARKLYWYAVTNVRGPFDARKSLDTLLSGWGVK